MRKFTGSSREVRASLRKFARVRKQVRGKFAQVRASSHKFKIVCTVCEQLHTTLPRCRNDVVPGKTIRRGVGEVSEQNGVGPTRLRHSHIGAVHRSIAPMCLDVGAVSEKCRSIALMCLDVGAVLEKCRSIAPRGLDVGAVLKKCWRTL